MPRARIDDSAPIQRHGAAARLRATGSTSPRIEPARRNAGPSVLIFDVDGARGGRPNGAARSRDVQLVGRLRAVPGDRAGTATEAGRSAVLLLRGGSDFSHRAVGQLTRRELDVVRLLADGDSTRDIAQRLSYSERTVKNIVRDLLAKLNCRTRAQAAALATRQGLI